MKRLLPLLPLICALAPAAGAVTITPIFDASITTSPNSADIITSINAAIAQVDGYLANPVSVSITFKLDETIGLGQSSTYVNSLSYSQYRSDLASRQSLSANDNSALATLPAGSTNPVNGGMMLTLTTPLLRAIGENSLGNVGSTPDSTISLKSSLMNLSRTGAQDPSKYDLQTVAMHEIDEVLGTGGAGSALGQVGTNVGPLDLFRFSAGGVRSFSTAAGTTAFFSIDNGVTSIRGFNQSAGADYADWAKGAFANVQDAFGSPGTQLNLSTSELTAFDVVGYDLTTVPEPSTWAMMGVGGLGLLWLRRRGRRVHP